MNQKKCPKCGENNPAEAVMCWACYTPLSGGATVAAGAGGAAAMTAPNTAVAANDDGEKKAAAPWQIGLVVGVLLLGLGFGAYSMMSPGDSGNTEINVNTGGSSSPGGGSGDPGSGGGYFAPPPPGPSSGGPSSAPVNPEPVPYTMVSPPNVNMSWGVMAIVPNSPNVSANKAASLAAFARRQYNEVKGWQGIHVYVFQDEQSAQAFKDYQTGRQSAPLGKGDYAALANLWPKCLARYEYKNGSERVLRPSSNPGAWWR